MKKMKLNEDVKLLEFGNTCQVAGLVFSRENDSFLMTLPHKHDDVYEPLGHLQLDYDDLEKLVFQLDVVETEMFDSDPSGQVKKIVRKTQRQIDGVLQWKVFKRDNYACRYCGRDGLPLSVDHIVLWEDGGPTIEDNLVTACKKCNRRRGNTEYTTWLKSQIYKKLSKNLSKEVQNKNMAIAMDLPRLKEKVLNNVRSR